MIILAKFNGLNSLGYEKGKEYKLNISCVNKILIKRLDNSI